MDQSPSPYWSQFFSQLNLSPEWVEHYSQSFSENSMQLQMIPDLQPDFMSYLGIHKLGHLIMIKNLADELLSRLSPLLLHSHSIPSSPSSSFVDRHSDISSINTNTNEIQSAPIQSSNTPHNPDVTNISCDIELDPSHLPDISSPSVFVFHTETTRPVVSRSHPSGIDTQIRNENDKYASPVKSGLVLSQNKIDDSQSTPVRNQLTDMMSSLPNSIVQNPTDSIPMLHTPQDTGLTVSRANLYNLDVSDIDPDEHSSPSAATHPNSIQLPTNSISVTAMKPVRNSSKNKRKAAKTKRKTSKKLRTKSPPIVVRLFDPGLYEELLSPPMSPQTMDLTITQQFDTNAISANTHVHDSEIGSVSRREDTTDSTLPTRPQMISVSLTELNSYEQHPISATVGRDLSENTQEYLTKFATELGELPNFFDQEKIKPCPKKKTKLRKKNKTKTQDVKLSPSKSGKLRSKKTRIGVRTNKLIKPMKRKTKLTLPNLKKKEIVRPMTVLPFDTRDRSISPEISEPELDRRIERSLSIVYYRLP